MSYLIIVKFQEKNYVSFIGLGITFSNFFGPNLIKLI